MDKSYRDFIDELDLQAYQFLFKLSDTDKLILTKFAILDNIEEWENMVKAEIKTRLPAYQLLDNIHLQFVMDKFNGNLPFKIITYERLQEIFEKNQAENNGIPNMLEVNTLALLESLKNDPRYAIA